MCRRKNWSIFIVILQRALLVAQSLVSSKHTLSYPHILAQPSPIMESCPNAKLRLVRARFRFTMCVPHHRSEFLRLRWRGILRISHNHIHVVQIFFSILRSFCAFEKPAQFHNFFTVAPFAKITSKFGFIY